MEERFLRILRKNGWTKMSLHPDEGEFVCIVFSWEQYKGMRIFGVTGGFVTKDNKWKALGVQGLANVKLLGWKMEDVVYDLNAMFNGV